LFCFALFRLDCEEEGKEEGTVFEETKRLHFQGSPGESLLLSMGHLLPRKKESKCGTPQGTKDAQKRRKPSPLQNDPTGDELNPKSVERRKKNEERSLKPYRTTRFEYRQIADGLGSQDESQSLWRPCVFGAASSRQALVELEP